MTAPAVVVEIAFNAGYNTPAASRTWTDVSAYVEQVASIGRGRAEELSEISASTLSLTLDNSDGRFTAGLATGAYYPNVKIGRPIRVTATPSGGSAVRRFVGYVDAWPVEWDGGSEGAALAKITASSRRARLGLNNELRSAVEEDYLADGPTAFYTLGDPEGSTEAADSSGNSADSLTMAGSGTAVVFGNATGPGTDDLTAATFAGGKYLRGSVSPASSPGGMWMECFFSTTTIPGSGTATLVEADITNTNGQWIIRLGVNASGLLRGLYIDPADGTPAAYDDAVSATSVTDGATHHALLVITSADDLTLYLDGAAEADVGAVPGTATQFGPTVTVGKSFTGAIAHAAVGSGAAAIDAARVAAHSEAGLTGFDGDTSDEWIARLAGWEGIATAEQDLDTGVATVTGLRPSGATVIESMQKVADTEGGLIYDDRDGDLRFRNRSHRYNQASAFTLDMSEQEVEADYAAILDRQGLVNDVTAGALDETIAAARVVDQTSVDDYGNARQSLTLGAANTTELTEAAGWQVNAYGEPRVRVPSLSVELATFSAADQALLLAADISTRFTVSNAPATAPATTAEYVVEGYSEDIGVGTHRITFNVSEAATWNVLELDDATLGQLDQERLAW